MIEHPSAEIWGSYEHAFKEIDKNTFEYVGQLDGDVEAADTYWRIEFK